MPLLYAVPDLGLVFKHDHFAPLAVPNHISDDLGSDYSRPAQRDLIPISDQVNSIQLDSITINRQFFHIDRLPGGNLVLLTSSLDYGVNYGPPKLTYREILPTPTHPVKLNLLRFCSLTTTFLSYAVDE